MKTILRLLALTILLLAARTAAAQLPDAPLLFTKQHNYQGLHIYDVFYQYRPDGGIYVLENPNDPPEKHRIRAVIDPDTPETLGPGVYSDTSLSYDAKTILFCFKGAPNGNTAIYEIGVDGKNLRQLTNLDKNGNPYKGSGGGHHDVYPCYLPDGRIVFSSTRYSGLVPCANNGVTILHIMNGDGSDIHTISVNNVTEFDPAVLPDGRILFGRWEYIDKNALTIQSIWTVNPCGTNETALYSNNMVFPEAVLQAKPVPGNPDLVVATFAPHNAPPRGTIAMIDTTVGKNDIKAIYNFETPNHPDNDRGNSQDPWALDENTVLYSGWTGGPYNVIMTIDRTGKKTVVLSDPNIDLKRPIPLVPREKPRNLPDTTDRTKITGDFFVQDVYTGNPGVPRGSVKWLRVIEETSRVSESPGGSWMNQTFSISAALAWSPKIYHGIVPVNEDGSVYFTAPSGRSLYFQLLDEDYRLVRGMRSFVQAAPGTVRSCTGCHEYGAPPTGAAAFVGKRPERLRDESWGSGYFDYTEKVQPILDEKCVSCHGGEEGFAGGLDLSGGWTELFNISYENLTARREKQYIADMISGICCMNGTAYWSCKIFGPYEHGSGNAPLAEVLCSEPHNTLLTPEERETVFTWIDSNGLYFGTWDYTKTGAYCREYIPAKESVKRVMRENGCAECHGDQNGNIHRFDDWINLENPRMSRVLRAPLSPDAKDGFGAGLCRARKVNPGFSRLGLMFKSGYEHAVRNLDQFPTQKWQIWSETLEGEPVISFADTENPVYREMLSIIEKAGDRQRVNPRVDMPFANEIGGGIIPGRSRQIIPQPLPETAPKVVAISDGEGVVRLTWERSARTIGLVSEVHRAATAGFTPSDETLLKRTELFEYTDFDAPIGEKAVYAVVFISDPAVTCGTMKSGAVILASDPDKAFVFAPTQGSIESRCPLSDFQPMRGTPGYAPIDIPMPKAPPAPERLRADVAPGCVTLTWDMPAAAKYGEYRYQAFQSEAGGEPQPVRAEPTSAMFIDVFAEGGKQLTFFVKAVGRGGESAASPAVTVKTPIVKYVTVFEMKEGQGTTVAGAAVLKGNVLDTTAGGHAVVPNNPLFDANAPFECEMDVMFAEAGNIPIPICYGFWNRSGWFLQRIAGQWRFHVGGVDCDGGSPPIGKEMHVRCSFDGRTLRVYQDGILVAERSGTPNRAPWPGNLHIAQYSEINGQFQFTGTIKNLVIRRQVAE